MWQRIQTLFLFLAAVSALAAAFIVMKMGNIFIINNHEDGPVAMVINFSNINIIVIIAIIAIITIFFYKKRKIQIKLCNINIILIIIIFVIFALGHIIAGIWSFSNKEIIILTLSVISLIFIIFAKKFIKKDEKKVRAWERIR